MTRALAAVLALSAGLASVSAAPAQTYGDQGYSPQGYSQQPYPDRSSDDPRYPDRDAERGGYGQPGDRSPGYGQQDYSRQPSGADRRGDDRGYQGQGYPSQVDSSQAYPSQGYQDRGYTPSSPTVDYRQYSTPTYPDHANGDRRYQADGRSIDPAPGAAGPYVGHRPATFYNVEARMDRVEARLAGLSASQRRSAYAAMRAIRAEERTQRGKHGGELRDWDREHLNQRLDALVNRYPSLRG